MFSINSLKILREKNNKTQKEIGNILGIDESCYRHYENSDDIISVKHLNTLANYYDTSIDYLLGLITNPNYITFNKNIDIDKFKIRLKELRKEKRITQNKLSNILNTSQSNIVIYESGKRLITTLYLYTLCDKYNISADYLLGRTDEPKYLK